MRTAQHTQSFRRRLALTTLAVTLTAVLTVGAGGGLAAKPVKHKHKKPAGLSGTWTGQYSGGYNGTFVLRWRQSGTKLTGTIKLSSPSGTFSISGSVHGKTIKFGAVAAGATYTGSVSGTSMSGTYQTVPKGGSWSAKKTA